jgi:hypothetical protein
MSVTHPEPDFQDADSFLHALLGLLAAGEELGAVLDAVEGDAPAVTPREDDALLHALLGLVRLRNQVIGVAESWAVDQAPPAPPATPEISPSPAESLLR